jgi:hypothetical protein
MGTESEDTDPSSPGALRPNSQGNITVAQALADPASGQPTTDPGLGPAVGPPSASNRRPMGVTVPAPSIRPKPGPNAITPPEIRPVAPPGSVRPPGAKDSVELLLEGMAGPRPERRKTTTPQSDGEPSAAYHAEHGVPRARTSEPAGPKVVVERPVPGTVLRERRHASGPRSREALSTFVPARVLRRRAAMALVAGVLIVLLSFMGLRLSGRRDPPAEAAPPPQSAAASMESASPVGVEPDHATAGPAKPPAPVAAPQSRGDSPPSSPSRPSGRALTRPPRDRAAGDAPGIPAGDLGEFKSKY